MFNHVTVGSNNLEVAKSFYDAVLPVLGWRCASVDVLGGWVTYSKSDPEYDLEFLVCRPINGNPATSANGVTIGLRAVQPSDVDAFYKNGLRAGGTSEGRPGPRDGYHAGFYGAYLRDPDGNKLCCVCNTYDRMLSAIRNEPPN